MRDLVRRPGALEIGLRAVHFLLCALHRRFVLMQFVLQFGNLEDREELTGAHAIADVNIDRPHVAGDLRVHVDLLEGAKCGGNGQDL